MLLFLPSFFFVDLLQWYQEIIALLLYVIGGTTIKASGCLAVLVFAMDIFNYTSAVILGPNFSTYLLDGFSDKINVHVSAVRGHSISGVDSMIDSFVLYSTRL